LELQEYKYDKPLYLWRKTGEQFYENGSFDEEIMVYRDGQGIPISEAVFEPLINLGET
jgi:hypothetical protein